MAKKRVSMQFIADYLNISKVTVYKALNNQQYVSEELREKIIKTAADLGYIKPDSKNTILNNSLAFIVPKRFFLESDSFYTSIFYYLNYACHNDGIVLTLYIINNEDEILCNIPNVSSLNECDGIFIAGEMSDNYINRISEFNLPLLMIDFYKPDLDCDCVIADNFFNGYTATNYLIEKGHTEIGFVGIPNQTSSIADRFFGYQRALSSHNLNFNPKWQLANNNPISGVYSLDIPLPDTLPSAFVCHCDRSAYFLIQRLNKENLAVPDDISIISFDNTDLAENSIPKLTTIDISTKIIAEKSYLQLRSRIGNNTIPKQRIYIPCKIVERDSVRAI